MATNEVRIALTAQDKTAAAFSSVKRNLGGIQTAANQVRSAFATLGLAASAFGLGRLAVEMAQFGDELNTAAKKAGVSGKAISELAYAAKQSNVELGALSTALRKMQQGLSEAASGTGEARTALAALGLNIRDLRALAPEKQFEILGDRISQLKDPADRTRASILLFGRAGADLLPLFEDGAEGIRKLRQEAQKIGQSFSSEQLQKLEDMSDSIDRLNASARSAAMAITAKFAPALTDLADVAKYVFTGQGIVNLETDIHRLRELQVTVRQGGSLVGRLVGNGEKEVAEALRQMAEIEAAIYRSLNLRDSIGKGKGTTQALRQANAPSLVGFGEKEQKQTAAELREMERFLDQARVIRQDASRLAAGGAPLVLNAAESVKAAVQAGVAPINVEVAKFEEQFDEITEFGREAARNLQDAFASFLFDPFSQGLDGMLKGFTDVLRQMVAEAASAQILQAIGGLFPTGSFFGTLFGGARAAGGPVWPGSAFLVGEDGPEVFVPRQSGNIVPGSKAAGGGMSVTIQTNMDNRGATTDLIKALPAILEASNRRAVELARRAINDDLSRGALGRA